LKVLLDESHQPPVPGPFDDEGVGRSRQEQQEEHSDRSNDQRVEQPRSVGDRHDVAVAGRCRADHREIDDVAEADVSVDIVAQAVPLDPVEGDDEHDHSDHDRHPHGELLPRT
jgi:hypothetical protein